MAQATEELLNRQLAMQAKKSKERSELNAKNEAGGGKDGLAKWENFELENFREIHGKLMILEAQNCEGGNMFEGSLEKQTSDNMDRWKSRGGKSQRGEAKK